MAKNKTFDLMIDSALFGETLSDFVKAHSRTLGAFTLGELVKLWARAKQTAKALLRA